MTHAALDLSADPEEVAAEAGLRYLTDAAPGIKRKRRRGTFAYILPSGEPVDDPATLQRIRLLAVPPAWEQVWIAPTRNAHIQATGRDQRGRKQYRYHPRWREVRDESKFGSLVAFGEALPKIRRRIKHDLALQGLPRDKVLATVVRLLDLTAMRVGNEEYTRANGSHGLTTLRDNHAKFGRGTVSFAFNGKSGKQHAIEVHDAQLARIVRRCRDLPGQELFQYLDANGESQSVDAAHVNGYIREAASHESGVQFGTKHFRTWDATLLAAVALRSAGVTTSETRAARNVRQAIEETARFLGNTVAVCRKAYVHPAVIGAYLEGRVIDAPSSAPRRAHLEAVESSLLAFLRAEQRSAARRGRGPRGGHTKRPSGPSKPPSRGK